MKPENSHGVSKIGLFTKASRLINKSYLNDRETVIRESARHLGFARVTETVKKTLQSAIRVAVRNSIIDRDKHGIIRP